MRYKNERKNNDEEGRGEQSKEIVEKKKRKRVVRINVEGGEEKLKGKMRNGKNKKSWDTSGTPGYDYTLLLLLNEHTENFRGAAIYWLQLMMTMSANKFRTNNFFSYLLLSQPWT